MGGTNSEALREAIAGMKEVQLMAEQKVGGLNMPGRRASMLGAPTLGRQATSSISAGETAAFLVFGDASNGTLYMYWTTAGYADGALAGFVPRKKVPVVEDKTIGGSPEGSSVLDLDARLEPFQLGEEGRLGVCALERHGVGSRVRREERTASGMPSVGEIETT